MKALFLLFCLIGFAVASNARGPSNFITVSDHPGSVAVVVADNLLILPPNETGLAKMEIEIGVATYRPPNLISYYLLQSNLFIVNSKMNQGEGFIADETVGTFLITLSGDAYESRMEIMMNKFVPPKILLANFVESNTGSMQLNMLKKAKITGINASDMISGNTITAV